MKRNVSRETMKSIDQCPLCGSVHLEFVFTAKDMLVSGYNFQLKDCKACGLRITSPWPEAGDLASFYQSEDYVSHSDKARNMFEWLYGKVKILALRMKTAMVRKYKPVSVLDIGCGTGSFLKELGKKGVEVVGIEPGLEARKLAEKKLKGKVYSSMEDFLDNFNGELDAITMWHVLEHIPDFRTLPLRVGNKLKSGGKFVVAVPINNSYDSMYYKGSWAAYDVPRHLVHFDGKTLHSLFESSGYTLIQRKPMWFDAFYVAMLTEKQMGNRIAFLKGLWVGMVSNLYAIFGVCGFSSEIYIFQKN